MSTVYSQGVIAVYYSFKLITFVSNSSFSGVISTEFCSQAGVDTNLLIIVLNVPAGGEMSYFRPWCERSQKKEGRGKQCHRTAGDPGAQHRQITPHQATKQEAYVSVHGFTYVCVCMCCVWLNEHRERKSGEKAIEADEVALGVDEVPSLWWPVEAWV